jgi:hypothetical protein
MQVRWKKAPVRTLGQLDELTVFVDGVAFTTGFAAAQGRMQHLVFGLAPARIEGGQEHRSSEMTETTGQRVLGAIEKCEPEARGNA